jgi:hypothetical protein
MRLLLLRFLLLFALLGAPLAAQEARVRVVDRVAMPTAVDSNSPAFWRDGVLYWYGSHGRPLLSSGAGQFGPWDTREVSFESPDAWPHWMEAVWSEDNGRLWGWYHTEPTGLIDDSTLTSPKIGAVLSDDGGNTLRDLGVILESGDPLDPSAQNGYFSGGHGDCSVIPDRGRNYFYFFFDNYGGPVETQGVCLARMAFDDRGNPVGRVWKYHNGSWTEPGRGGRVTPLFPVKRGWQLRDPDAFWGPSVHWNTALKCYVMLLNRAAGEPGWAQEGIYVSFCTDLSRPETWTPPAKILDKASFPGWYFFYPQVMGLESGGSDTRAGATARLYVGGISRWEIDFTPTPAAPGEVKLEMTPAAGVVAPGAAAAFAVTATGTGTLTYQWFKNGSEIPGATAATFGLAGAAAGDAGAYAVVVTNALGSAVSNVANLAVAALPPVVTGGYITNLSARATLVSGDDALTLGYVVAGAAAKPLLLRAIGPTLGAFGVVGAVNDPRLETFDAASVRTAANDDWLAADAAAFAAAGAFPLAEGSRDAALSIKVAPGAGTARVTADGPGAVLVEIYDPAASRVSRITNVSARSFVGGGDAALIGGFTLGGSGRKQLLIRALGPQLAAFGVAGALADPVVELYDAAGARIGANDNWSRELTEVFAAAGAAPLPSDSADAAIAPTLDAGRSYSVVVRSRDGSPGEAMLEIYVVP